MTMILPMITVELFFPEIILPHVDHIAIPIDPAINFPRISHDRAKIRAEPA